MLPSPEIGAKHSPLLPQTVYRTTPYPSRIFLKSSKESFAWQTQAEGQDSLEKERERNRQRYQKRKAQGYYDKMKAEPKKEKRSAW